VQGKELIAGPNAPSPDEVVLSKPLVSIASGCGPVTARFLTTRKGMRIRAAWTECREPGREVALKATIDPACKVMTGLLVGRKLKLERRFIATLSDCGDDCQPGSATPLPSSAPTTKLASDPAKAASGSVALLGDNGAFSGGRAEAGAAPQWDKSADRLADDRQESGGRSLDDPFSVDLVGSRWPGWSRDHRLQGEAIRGTATPVNPTNRDGHPTPAPVAFTKVAPVRQPGGEAGKTSAASKLEVTLENGTLTAQLLRAPLRRVLEEIGNVTGAEVRGLEVAGNETISVSFAQLPLQEAIERILRTKSFALVTTGADGHMGVTRIVIIGLAQASDAGDRVASVPAAPTVDVQMPAEGLAQGGDVDDRASLDAPIAMAFDPEDSPESSRHGPPS